MIKGLYETHLYVENLENSIEFHSKVLGLKQCRFGAERRTAFFGLEMINRQCLVYGKNPKKKLIYDNLLLNLTLNGY